MKITRNQIRKLIFESLKDSDLYFAYGSNIDTQEMDRKKISYKDLGHAVLPNHSMRYSGYGKVDPTGRADIYFDSGNDIDGRLYVVHNKHRLDSKEGTKNPGLYKRKKIKVFRKNKKPVNAYTYDMPNNIENNEPDISYLKKIKKSKKSLVDIMNEADPKVGTGKKPKGSGRRLYTDENPKDTVRVKFSSASAIRQTLAKKSFKSKPHNRQSQIINLIHQRARAAYKNAKNPKVKKRLKRAYDYAKKRKEASKRKTQRMRNKK